MHAERAPVLGIALAMLILAGECLGLVAYAHHQRADSGGTRELTSRDAAVRDAFAAKQQLDEVMSRLDQLDAELQRDAAAMTPAERKARLRELYQQLEDLRRERLQLHDMLIRQRAPHKHAF